MKGNHMTTQLMWKKHLTKSKTLIKALNKSGLGGNFLNLTKDISGQPKADILLSGDGLEVPL